jgi:hypothetical protein
MRVYIRRKRVVKLVIVRYVRLSKSQAEIRLHIVPPEFSYRANSITYINIYRYYPTLSVYISDAYIRLIRAISD